MSKEREIYVSIYVASQAIVTRKIVYYGVFEKFQDKRVAAKREREIKGWRRELI